ncbi:hypothetical protein FRB90_007205 [Tulasnella sp. 427]|nr:hypothetical protein FRB90_007205 [Tulasnella sp. 427]
MTCEKTAPPGSCGATDAVCLCQSNDYITAVKKCLDNSCTGQDLQNAITVGAALCRAYVYIEKALRTFTLGLLASILHLYTGANADVIELQRVLLDRLPDILKQYSILYQPDSNQQRYYDGLERDPEIFAKYGLSRIFYMCNLHLTTNPEIRGPRKLYFCVMIHPSAQGHIVYEEKLHRSILQAQWNNAKREEDIVNPSTLASIGKVGVEDTTE